MLVCLFNFNKPCPRYLYIFFNIWILDNCPENKVQPFCQGLSRRKGEVRIHVKFKFCIKVCERVFSNNRISRNKPVFILAGLIIKTYEKMPVKTSNLVTLSVSISFFFFFHCNKQVVLIFSIIFSTHGDSG